MLFVFSTWGGGQSEKGRSMRIMNDAGTFSHPLEKLACYSLYVSVFGSAFSLPLGRAALALSLVLLVVGAVRRKTPFKGSGVLWLGVAFLCLTVIVTFFGVNPKLGVAKLDKLVWFAGVCVAPLVFTQPDRIRVALRAYALGCLIVAVSTFGERYVMTRELLASGFTDSLSVALAHGASITDSQRLMMGALASIAVIFIVKHQRSTLRTWWWLVLAIEMLALLLTFKRGAWISTAVVSSLMVVALTRWRYIFVPVALVGLLCLTPFVQDRLGKLTTELNIRGGGRMTMWFEITPALIRAHPWGIGYRSLTNEMMRDVAPYVEPNRDHLHSNIAQVLVATGWLGLVLYMLWMLAALHAGWKYFRAARDAVDPPDTISALAVLCMLTGLLLNGVVEYNLGDGELVLAYGFLMGTCIAGQQRYHTVV